MTKGLDWFFVHPTYVIHKLQPEQRDGVCVNVCVGDVCVTLWDVMEAYH